VGARRPIVAGVLGCGRMRSLVILTAVVMTAGCSGSKWKPCKHLEITTRDGSNQQRWLRYEDARYRVLDTDPLTIEWEHTSCVELESKSGTVEEICGRESQTGPVDRVACR
jgi:hypothetical protein